MDFQCNLTRAVVYSIVGKSINDIQRDSDRSIRKLVDMGVHFAKGKNQREFFNLAQDMVSNKNNPYSTLVKSITLNVDENVLRTISTNLGYVSFTYGVNTLRRNEQKIHHHIPWLIVFERDMKNTFNFEIVERFIENGIELGIYTYIFRGVLNDELIEIFKIAEENNTCSFFIEIVPELITKELCCKIRKIQNIVPVIETNTIDCTKCETNTVDCTKCETAFKLLEQNKCLYGFSSFYDSKNIDSFISDSFINKMMSYKCAFGVYINQNITDKKIETPIYSFALSVRGRHGKPIILFDWYRDMDFIGNLISKGSGIMRIDSKGNISSDTGIKASFEDVTNLTLKELIEKTPQI